MIHNNNNQEILKIITIIIITEIITGVKHLLSQQDVHITLIEVIIIIIRQEMKNLKKDNKIYI